MPKRMAWRERSSLSMASSRLKRRPVERPQARGLEHGCASHTAKIAAMSPHSLSGCSLPGMPLACMSGSVGGRMYMTWRLSHRDTDFRFMIVVRFRTGLWCSRNVRYVWGPALGNSSWGGGRSRLPGTSARSPEGAPELRPRRLRDISQCLWRRLSSKSELWGGDSRQRPDFQAQPVFCARLGARAGLSTFGGVG